MNKFIIEQNKIVNKYCYIIIENAFFKEIYELDESIKYL